MGRERRREGERENEGIGCESKLDFRKFRFKFWIKV